MATIMDERIEDLVDKAEPKAAKAAAEPEVDASQDPEAAPPVEGQGQ